MLAQSRAVRLMAGVLVVVLAVPLVLSTPWAKAWVFERVAAWARGRHGLEIRAESFDYRLRSLSVTVQGLTAAEVETPDRPIARAARLDLDFAAPALLGRLDLDSIRLRDAHLVLDATTRRPRPATTPTVPTATASLPPFSIGSVEVENLDIAVDIAGEARLTLRRVSAALRGRTADDTTDPAASGEAGLAAAGAAGAVLAGELAASGGVEVTFADTDVIRVAFDRAEARVALDQRSRVTGTLTATSPVGDIRAEGGVPLALDQALDLQYEGGVALEQLHHWWSDAPDWTGRATLRGNIRGPLRSPDASYRLKGADLGWRSLAPAALAASGHVSTGGLVVEAFTLASRAATLDGHGTLAFRAEQPSEFGARWSDLGADIVVGLLSRSFASESSTAISGAAQLTWPGPRPGVGSIAGHVEATGQGAAPDGSAIGTVVADGRGGQWQISYRQALDGDTVGTLQGLVSVNVDRIADSAVGGSLSIEGRDVHRAVTQVQRLGLALPAAAASVGSARVVFDGAVDGTLAAPRLSGAIDADGVRAGALDGVRLQGDVTLDAQGLAVSPLNLEASGSLATLRGAMPWRDGTGKGTFEAHVEDLSRLARTLPQAWRPRGIVDASGEWTGSMQDLGVTSQIAGTELTVNGVAFDAASARASFSQGRLEIDDLRATRAGGTLTGSGSWNLTDATVTAGLAGRNLALDVLMPAEDGTLATRAHLADVSFDARLAGAARRPDGTVTLDVGSADVAGRAFGAVTMRADAAGGVAHVAASAPSQRATLDGRLTLDAPWPFEGRLSFTGTDVAGLARLAGASDAIVDRLDATFDATIDASGSARDVATTDAALSVTRIDGAIRNQPVSLAEAGRLQLQDERVRVVEPVRVTWGSTSVALTQTPASATLPGVAVSLEGAIAELMALAPGMLPEGVAAEGTVTAEVLLGDRLTDIQPAGQMTITLATLTRGAQELARETTIAADADLTTIRVRELRGTVLGGPFEARGSAPAAWLRTGHGDGGGGPAEPATFWLKSGAAAGAVVSLLRDRAPVITGALNLTVEGSAMAPRLDAVRATVRNEASELTVGGFALMTREPTELRLEEGLLHVDHFEWQGPRSTVAASGSVALADGLDGRLKVAGNGSLAFFGLLLPARVEGQATFDLEISGPPGQRDVLGTAAIEDGSMVEQSWRLAMADWSGSVVLERDRIDVKGLRGQFNGGEATIEGHVPVGAGTTATQALAVVVRGAFLDLPRGLRSQLDANLEWSHAGSARLSGDITVTARTYREPVTEIARIAAALIDGSGGQPMALPAALARTDLDIHLSTVGPLTMTNSVARVELVPDLRLTGTLSRPALRGQVAVLDDGRIQFGGRQYRLRESRVEFSPERGLMPRLAVSGETRVADYTVFLRFSGTADEIETALSSDPPLGERDLQTLLVTGQREVIGRGGTSEQNAVGAVSGDVLGVAGQVVGFDAVTVSTTDDLALVSSDVDPALRLTVSKRIGRRFELVLSDNLDDNELTWVIIYRPRPGFEFRALSRDNTEFTGEFRQEIFFGPGVAVPRTVARTRVARDRVANVTVSGEPGFASADVLSATSIKAGDRFDFARWLEDRDRIAKYYQQHGYFAARIVPTRRPLDAQGGEPRVALDYRVTRGPRTVLSVAGYAAAPELEDQLRQAWTDSVLVDLLDGDLTRVMREHLIDTGFLRAAVDVEVDHSRPDEVTAAIRVEPGVRSTDRRLAFSGNTVLDDKALLEASQADDELVSPWQDPAPLLELLQSIYAARGYLAMQASVDAIAFADTTATLPIRIVEGPEARVTSVTLNGADRVTPADAAAATGLSVGATYVAGSEQAARILLERYYRNLGHRDVAVDLQSTVNADEGRVDVAVTVKEGPRYIVRAVQTTGVESTRVETVERATRIEPGSPASPAVADGTRRQLYDIGTFRSADVTFVPVEGAAIDATVPVDAVVTLQESKRFLLLYGLEVTNQYQSLFDQRVTSGGVAVDLRDRNFLGRGWTLGAGVRYEPSFESARVLWTVPRLGSKPVRTNLYADTRSEERARTEEVIFRDLETTLTLEQRWRPRTAVELSWGYRYNRRDLRFLDATNDDNRIDFNFYLASLAGAVVIDRRDNLFDAKRGWLLSATAEWGLQAIGSDFDYLRTTVRGSHYQPAGPVTLASNVRWGDVIALKGTPTLIALDLFYTAGGTQTVRGYQQDSLSAFNPEIFGTVVVAGGSKLLVVNEEVRFPLFGLFSGAAFVDAGNTFTDETGIVLSDMAVGAGFGLRIRTPLAPVRIDVGFPVSSRTGQTGARWHFSIGQIF